MDLMAARRRLLMMDSSKAYTVTGNPVSFETNLAKPLRGTVIPFTPIQSGSGDPSPQNIRPISGKSSVTIYHSGQDTSNPSTYPVAFPAVGKNLFDKNGTYPDTGKYLNSSGQITSSANWTVTYIPVTIGLKYSISGIVVATTSAYTWWVNTSKEPLSVVGVHNDVSYNGITAPENSAYIAVSWISNTNNAAYDGNTLQVEQSNSATAYEPFTNTIYGGTLDAVNGVVEVSNGYIASYNGETLPGKWISDRDVYVAGTTPTTGAEVVYELAEPYNIHLSSLSIPTLVGDNVVWTDTNGSNIVAYLKRG